MSDPSSQTIAESTSHNSRRLLLAALSLLLVLVFAFTPTAFTLGKLDAVGYAVCHRIPERSFFLGGHVLPLCARCSGTFLGVTLTLLALSLAGRARASHMPPLRVLVILGQVFWNVF